MFRALVVAVLVLVPVGIVAASVRVRIAVRIALRRLFARRRPPPTVVSYDSDDEGMPMSKLE